MHHARLIALVLTVTACASSTGGGTSGTTVTPMTAGMLPTNGGTLDMGATAEVTAISTGLPIPPDSAYTLLRAVYVKLAIPVAQQDASHRSIGNHGLKVRRELGGLGMEKILDCGDKIGVPNAETWDIQMDISSYVTVDHGGSQLWTRIQALGNDPGLSGRNLTPCSTRGDLEAKIGTSVKALLAGK
jgi:hypothetical protein